MNILVLGTGGMLGHMVFKELSDPKYKYKVYGTQRDFSNDNKISEMFVDVTGEWARTYNVLVKLLKIDYVINCIGIIKPHIFLDRSRSIYVNSLFPRQLAKLSTPVGVKVIHITTDCVFSGKRKPESANLNLYKESDSHDITDLYGRSKSLGEPEEAMSLRTSIIGPEVHNKVSLLEWFLSQDAKVVTGYTNHLWNGITTKEFAKVVDKIIKGGLWVKGVRHVFMPQTITKHQMLVELQNKYQLNVKINAQEDTNPIDRTLGTLYSEFLEKLGIPSFVEMLGDLNEQPGKS